MLQEALSTFLQQNLLVLLTHHDEQARIIRGAVSLDLYEGPYHQIASAIYGYIDRQRTTPKDHLPELFEDVLLNRKDEKTSERARYLETILYEIHDQRDKVNVKFVMSRLEQFIRHQEIKKATLEVAEVVHQGPVDDETIKKAEEIFSRALKKRIAIFDPGISLGDAGALAFLEEQEGELFRTGIEALDEADLGPRRGALHLFVGLPKMGKTWYLVNLGSKAWRDGYRVLHISLEMSAAQILRRYHQAIWAIARRRDQVTQRTKLRISTDGDRERLKSIKTVPFTPRHALDDEGIYKYLVRRRKRIEKRLDRVVVKAFPTGQLTLRELESYLDALEMRDGFIPDLMLVDYPQLMSIRVEYQRLDLGRIVVGLRGLAVERNMAVAAVSQSSRKGYDPSGGEKGRLSVITSEHIAEDFSQSMTADVILTYNQTRAEKEINLARIYVADARDQEARFAVLIAQSYATGQFCTRSIRMKRDTEKLLLSRLGSDEDEEDEEEEEE